MDEQLKAQLKWLEQRSRALTGGVLGILALVACYGLMIVEGNLSRPAVHFYPWMVGILFYLAGDLLAYVWYRVVQIKLQVLLDKMDEEHQQQIRKLMAEEDMDEDMIEGDVEILKPMKPE